MRWRTENEVLVGKGFPENFIAGSSAPSGQFICGNKSCNEKNALKSLEVRDWFQG